MAKRSKSRSKSRARTTPAPGPISESARARGVDVAPDGGFGGDPTPSAVPPPDTRSGGTRALVAVGLVYAVAFGAWFLLTSPDAASVPGPASVPATSLSSENLSLIHI